MRILVTGGAGFIGSGMTRHFVREGHEVAVADRFTYAGKARNLREVLRHVALMIGDLCEPSFAVRCAQWRPDAVVHLAAETHVDRAIEDPCSFMRSNAMGTTVFLDALARQASAAKILVYSTDEVYGATPLPMRFTEQSQFAPSNAYSASKVAVEGIAHAMWVTHGLQVLIVRPCNTYGPGQHPEKVVPKFIRQCLAGGPITVYNDGQGARDWLHITDHAQAIACLLEHGEPGSAYNLAAEDEHTDEEIAQRILTACDRPDCKIAYVPGRPGHDRRYAMWSTPLRRMGWQPLMPFNEGIQATIDWTLAHPDWWDADWIKVT